MRDRDILGNLRRYREDPWEFFKDCVFTLDPKDRIKPIKSYPAHFEYLKLFTRIWQKENLICVPKSRRMFMSWQCVALYTWDTLFYEGRHNAFVSKKELDADALLDRAKFILDHIPPDKLPRECMPKFKKTYTLLEFPETLSKIQGFPSGADQLRMHGFSGILNDEMAFQDNAHEMYASSFPTIENGGRMTAISSPAKGFYYDLVFDNLDMQGGRNG